MRYRYGRGNRNRRKLSRDQKGSKQAFRPVTMTGIIAIVSILANLALGLYTARNQYVLSRHNTSLEIKTQLYDEMTTLMSRIRRNMAFSEQFAIDRQPRDEQEIDSIVESAFAGMGFWQDAFVVFGKVRPFVSESQSDELEGLVTEIMYTIDRLHLLLLKINTEKARLAEQGGDYFDDAESRLDPLLTYYFQATGRTSQDERYSEVSNLYELEDYLHQKVEEYRSSTLESIFSRRDVSRMMTELVNMESEVTFTSREYYSSLAAQLIDLGDEVTAEWF